MKVNVCSDTKVFNIHGEGVSTSFETCIALLKEKNDIEVSVNGESKGDIMHSHNYGPYYFLRGLLYKGKKVHTVHTTPETAIGTLPGWKLMMPFFKWYFKKAYSFADVCIAISPMVEQSIRSLGAKTRIINIPNPIQINKWKRTETLRVRGRKLLELKEGEICVLSVGQLINRKGVLDFIEVGNRMAELAFRWIGGRPHGSFSDGYRAINQAVEESGSNVQFSGAFDQLDMPAIYAAGDIFMFPSYQENCPLAPLEAAASGMPVIFRDLIEYQLLYENTYLKAKSNQDFESAIKMLVYDDFAFQHGLELSEKLITQFDEALVRQKLMEVYRSLQ